MTSEKALGDVRKMLGSRFASQAKEESPAIVAHQVVFDWTGTTWRPQTSPAKDASADEAVALQRKALIEPEQLY